MEDGLIMEMNGQLSYFPEKQDSPAKTKKKKEEKSIDPSQTYDERMKRFWHYMENKGMNEQWIETCVGELRIIVDALADYYDMAGEIVEAMEMGYPKAAWKNRLERIKQIQAKIEESTGYSRDDQFEICMKRKPRKDNDIGEEALVLALK